MNPEQETHPPASQRETVDRQTGLEPELGGYWRDAPERTGLEPELGGLVRQKGVYVDEVTCIGCKHCAHVARNTFYIEPDYGRSRVIRQDADPEEVIQEAIDTCPVDCIHWVDYTELKHLEEQRKDQVIPVAGFPVDHALTTIQQRQRRLKRQARDRHS
ncbi:ferredoxin [Oscillatoria sp. FACHB-1407]|uniref:ferredoxin n=1 Tax=Oscillatoria sp. FACHB-1407 TaxID=2692847 RepID=UPI0018F03BA1|nr:ferredoxin [Oscillatoria sp. FACHB-1407]